MPLALQSGFSLGSVTLNLIANYKPMQIQWYPGHMHKAGKEIKETLPNIDVIIEVLDARHPF